jgi:hypothetical protein
MTYYTFIFKNDTYIIDIDFFVNIISDEINDIEFLLSELNINKIELDEFDFLDDYVYIYNNNQINTIKLTEELINEIKQYFINFLYKSFENNFNIQHIFKSSQITSEELGFYFKNPTYFEDKELCFLDILNSGIESNIVQLENFLELNTECKRYVNDFLHNTKFNEESLIKSYSINELIINLIIYADKLKYDLNSMNITKQLIYDGE